MSKGTAEFYYLSPCLRNPLTLLTNSLANYPQFAGRTLLASGSATVEIVTSCVRSDSMILFGSQAPTNTASGKAGFIEVKSINPGAAFSFGIADGNTMARDTTIMWLIFQKG